MKKKGKKTLRRKTTKHENTNLRRFRKHQFHTHRWCKEKGWRKRRPNKTTNWQFSKRFSSFLDDRTHGLVGWESGTAGKRDDEVAVMPTYAMTEWGSPSDMPLMPLAVLRGTKRCQMLICGHIELPHRLAVSKAQNIVFHSLQSTS